MRRRRNADAPSSSSVADATLGADLSAENSAAEPTENATPTASEPNSETVKTVAPKPRRRASTPRGSKKAADAEAVSPESAPETGSATASAEPEIVSEPAATPEAEAADTEARSAEATPVKPKRAYKRRAKNEPQIAEVVETEAQSVEVADAIAEPDATPAEAQAETIADAPADAVAAADEAPATEETPATPARPARKPRTPRSASRRAAEAAEQAAQTPTASADTGGAPELATPTVADLIALPALTDEVAPALEANEAADTEDQSEAAHDARPSRRRGRQRRAANTAEPSGETTTAKTATAQSAPAAAPVDAPATSRRVRGVPRRRETSAASAETGSDSETSTPAARGPQIAPLAVEPLPPPYQPLSAEILERLPLVRVAPVNGRPQILVNEQPRLPYWFFVNTQDEESAPVAVRQIRMAYEAGIRFFTLLVHLPWKARTGERRYGPIDDVLQMMAENAPDALILPRLIFSPPNSWERANPNEMSRYDDGETGDVSLGSRLFWEGEADATLRAAVEYVAQGDHAHRIAGFYLEHGEWLLDKDRGPDVSEANTSAFRTWLRAKYKSLVNLRASWHDGGVTFETAQIPSDVPSTTTLFWGDRQQRQADLAQFESETAASIIVRLAKSVKEASGNRSAVAVSYGYSLEVMRANSGHLDLARVLASPNVDILTGPISYSGRLPGGSAPLPVPLDSVLLAGKLWISEDDTKTFLASNETPDSYNPKIDAPEGTWAAHSRNFGTALARGAGVSWMDLWGEGWLDDRYVWENIAHLNDIAVRLDRLNQSIGAGEPGAPDVAVFVDERSFFDVPPGSGDLLMRLVSKQRDSLLRSGAKVGFYLLSDLLNPHFPKSPRLLLFLNAFHLSDALRTAVRAQQDDGKTLAWLFGPGCRDESIGDAETVGIQLKLQPWGSKTGTTLLSNVRSPLTETLRGQKLGDEARTNPSYYVNDPKATVLGEYASGLPSVAYRKHPRWQSVFIGEPELPLNLLRGLYRLAGVPVATVDDDVAVFGDGIVSLHSAPGGGTTVYLGDDVVLYDLLTNETISSGGFGSRLSMPVQGSRLLLAGSPADIRAVGGDPDAAPYGLNEDELPLLPDFVFEAPPASATSPTPIARPIEAQPATPEDAALMEAAFASDFSFDDKENDAEDDETSGDGNAASAASAAEADAKKKRRRRRRGANKKDTATPDAASAEGVAVAGESDETEADEEGDLFADVPDTDEDAASATPETENTEGSKTEETINAVSSGENEAQAETEPSLFAEPVASAAPVVPPGPPARLTLDELLPQSTLTPDTGDLPPIPDELLPLDPATFTVSAAQTESGETAGEAAPAPETEAAPRRRRGRPRRALTAADETTE